MKKRSLLASLLCSTSLAFSQVTISPPVDPFPQPANAEIPCMIGFPFIPPTNGQGVIQYNTYYSSLLAVHPKNQNLLISAMNVDWLQEVYNDTGGNPQLSNPRTQEVALATSSDGGNSWTTSFIPFHLCLNGTLSNGQSVSALRYSPVGNSFGTIFMAGRFSDLQNSTDPNNFSGIWVTRSTNGGASWLGLTPSLSNSYTIVSVQNSDALRSFVGTADGTPDLTYDPNQLSNLYLAWDRPVYSEVSGYQTTIPLRGNIFLSRSNNVGASWMSPTQIYDIQNDIAAGGQCTGVALGTAQKGTTTSNILCSFMRYYSNGSSPSFDKTVATTTTDRVVIRSSDGGQTWSSHAHVVAPFVYAQSYNPKTSPAATPVYPSPDGSELAHMVANPNSGRVYLQWQAGSLAETDPNVARLHPEIVLSVSRDRGRTWSKPAKVSRTPVSLLTTNPPAYQAFNGNIVFLPNDLIGVVYYDFRKYHPNLSTVSTDAWMAIYQEVKSKHGGSTGIGLDFVGEVRITNPSFDYNVVTKNSAIGLMRGMGNVIGVAGIGNKALTAYTVSNPGQDSPHNISNVTVADTTASVDTNNRLSVDFQSILVAPIVESSSSSSSSSSTSSSYSSSSSSS